MTPPHLLRDRDTGDDLAAAHEEPHRDLIGSIGRPELGPPRWHIAAPSAREPHWGYGNIETARLGAQCLQWISSRGEEHDIRLVRTRNYVPRQTACYADWLLFQEDEAASQFLTAFPRFQFRTGLRGSSMTGRSSPHAWRSG